MLELNYKKLGNGPPLLVLHGLFGMLDNWQTLAKEFAKDYEVWLIDQRNHGKSPHTADFDYYLLAEDIANLIEKESIQPYILGHSMGGKTAMQLSMDYPSLIKKLIVVDIAPKNYPPGHDDIFKAFFSIDLETLENRKEADEILAKTISEWGVRQFLLKNLTKKEGKYRWKANVQAIFENYDQIIANSVGPFQQFDNPTLFIKGGKSPRYIEYDDWPEVLNYFPDARLETVEGAGHWVHAEKPKELLDLVLNFLKED